METQQISVEGSSSLHVSKHSCFGKLSIFWNHWMRREIRLWRIYFTNARELACFIGFVVFICYLMIPAWSGTRIGTSSQGGATDLTARTGVVSNFLLGLVLLFSPRWISFLWNYYLLGLSYQEMLPYHRRVGNVALLFVSLHFFYAVQKKGWSDVVEESANVYGLVSWAFLLLIFVSSFWFVRRYLWEIFYYLHLPFSLGIVLFGILHTLKLEERNVGQLSYLHWFVIPGIVLFVIDRVGRLIIVFVHRAKIEEFHPIGQSHARVLISSSKIFHFSAGQIVFLCVPRSGPFCSVSWHPFSIASNPANRGHLALIVKKNGKRSWTNYFRLLAEAQGERMSLFIEGPYGVSNAHMVWSDIDAVVFSCGGVGGTPIIPFLYEMALDANKKYPRLQRVYVLWSGRNSCDQLWDQFGMHGDNLWELLERDTEKFRVSFFDTGRNQPSQYRYVAERTTKKRPNYDDIAEAICEEWSLAVGNSGYARIAVVTCGPEELMHTTVIAFDKWTRFRQCIIVDVHRETFLM